MKYNIGIILKLKEQEEKIRKVVKKFIPESEKGFFDIDAFGIYDDESFDRYNRCFKDSRQIVKNAKCATLNIDPLLNLEDLEIIKLLIEKGRYYNHSKIDSERRERLVNICGCKLNKLDEEAGKIFLLLDASDFSLIRELVLDEEDGLLSKLIERMKCIAPSDNLVEDT